jgi:hypothetical protein
MHITSMTTQEGGSETRAEEAVVLSRVEGAEGRPLELAVRRQRAESLLDSIESGGSGMGLGRKTFVRVGIVAILAAVIWVSTAVAAPAIRHVSVTANTQVDGTGHNLGNVFDGKEYVWLDGSGSFGDGDYFFAVLTPGGQPNPNDGSAGNLSSDYDAFTNRTFSVANGAVSYDGTHDFDLDQGYVRLSPYADSVGAGGVYVLAVCSLADGYPVDPSQCSYAVFRVAAAED